MSALKGQQDDSPGKRPGYVDGDSRPERAKDLRLQYDNSLFVNLLPLQGGAAVPRVPRAMPWADIFWSFRPKKVCSFHTFYFVFSVLKDLWIRFFYM